MMGAAAGPAGQKTDRRGIYAAQPWRFSIDELIFGTAIGDDDLAAGREILGERHEIALRFLDILEPHRAHGRDLLAQELAGALGHVGEEEVAQRLGRAFEGEGDLVLLGVAQDALDGLASSLPRSSKVNMSALMRSAASRLRSSSAVMKRLSVLRSRLLKISAMSSCESRRLVRARLEKNSFLSVRSTSSSTSFCTASMRSMRMMTSMAKLSGSCVNTRPAWSDLIFERTTATVCGYSFLR